MNGEERAIVEQVVTTRVEGLFKELAAKMDGVTAVLTERMQAGDRETRQLVAGVESEMRHLTAGMKESTAAFSVVTDRLERAIATQGKRVGRLEQDAAVTRSKLEEARSDVKSVAEAQVQLVQRMQTFATGVGVTALAERVTKLEHFRWLIVGAILAAGGLSGGIAAVISKAPG